MKTYDKIVRDKIPEIIESTGKNLSTKIVSKDETINYLIKKFSEEIAEFEEDHSTEELADILEIIHGLAYHLNIDFSELESIRKEKSNDRGGFEKSIVLKEVW